MFTVILLKSEVLKKNGNHWLLIVRLYQIFPNFKKKKKKKRKRKRKKKYERQKKKKKSIREPLIACHHYMINLVL